jgi:hypothetical protein
MRPALKSMGGFGGVCGRGGGRYGWGVGAAGLSEGVLRLGLGRFCPLP